MLLGLETEPIEDHLCFGSYNSLLIRVGVMSALEITQDNYTLCVSHVSKDHRYPC